MKPNYWISFLLLIGILMMGNRPHTVELTGHWLRINDDFAGMLLEVEQTKNGYVGTFINVPNNIADDVYKVGNVKWKGFHEVEENTYHIRSLGRTSMRQGKGVYRDMYLKVVSQDQIEIQAFVQDLYIGNIQTWIRKLPEQAKRNIVIDGHS